jgi:hypothetical protein
MAVLRAPSWMAELRSFLRSFRFRIFAMGYIFGCPALLQRRRFLRTPLFFGATTPIPRRRSNDRCKQAAHHRLTLVPRRWRQISLELGSIMDLMDETSLYTFRQTDKSTMQLLYRGSLPAIATLPWRLVMDNRLLSSLWDPVRTP